MSTIGRSMQPVVQRLKQSRDAAATRAWETGERCGYDWAAHTANWEQLQAWTASYEEKTETPIKKVMYFLMLNEICRQIDRYRTPDGMFEQEYGEGFFCGIDKLWEEVKDQLTAASVEGEK